MDVPHLTRHCKAGILCYSGEDAVQLGPGDLEETQKIIHEYKGAIRGSAAGKTNPAWRGTPASTSSPSGSSMWGLWSCGGPRGQN